jgi:phospholipid/cholesterol/gamma-HCH transport system substrate-binding protein
MRWVPVALLLAAVVIIVVLLVGSGPRHYRIAFQNAGQLVKGDVVRIGGVPAGKVASIGLTDSGEASIEISLKKSYGPLHEGTSATVRQEGIAGVASRYVDLSPGPDYTPRLGDGTTITADKTTSIVDLDQLFNTLDPKTRKGLQGIIDGSASWYQGREQLANASARQFPRALAGLTNLAQQITKDDATFQQFLVKTGDAMGALTARREELTALISNTRRTSEALGSNTESLRETLANVPPALRQGTQTFRDMRPALTDLQALTDAAGPATKDLVPFLRKLRPVLDRSTPTFKQLRQMFAQPGASNDLLDAFKDLPALDRLTKTGFAAGQKSLKDSTPVFSFSRPYVPDLVGWVRGFSQVMAPYDANGHYARTEPVFDAYTLTDTPEGGEFAPKPADQRGTAAALSSGNLRRCPGAAAPSAFDGSSPFVDDGPLANPDCNPQQVPGRGQ